MKFQGTIINRNTVVLALKVLTKLNILLALILEYKLHCRFIYIMNATHFSSGDLPLA